MSLGYGYDAELWQFSQQLYPDLPPIEAYLALHRDYVAPMVRPVINGTLTLAEIVDLFREPTSPVARLHGLRIAGQVAERLYDHIKALLTAGIWKQYKAGTLSQSDPFPDGIDMAAAGASVSGENVKNVPKDITDYAASGASAGSGPTESLLDRVNYLECWNTALRMIQTLQAQHMIKALNVIADHLGDRNCIAVMGAGGPDGFARPIYDLIKMKISDIDAADLKNHRFFVYHDSNNWHPAFKRLTSENPLRSEFVNNPCDDLDHACLFMREVRQKLLAKDENRGKDIKFHLLIPSWSKLQIKEPLHFPEDLYPLQIEGLKHGGKDQVELNLPAAPAGLLHGVTNTLDPNNWNKIARGTSEAVTLPAVGWGVNGACLATSLCVGSLTPLGPLLAIPLWIVSARTTMEKSAPVIYETIHDALREEDPRVLGSKERLHMPQQDY
ncbi:hypothetical protein BDV09DRAFT_203924 [Aspergillus tetrazonus]